MKRALKLITAALALTLPALAQVSAQEIAFDANVDLLKPPENAQFGEVAGVATNSKGHIFVYTRTGVGSAVLGGSRTFYHGGSRLFEFDQNGKYVKEIGQGLYGFNFAQGLRIDPQDNIWAVDQGSGQVIKFDPDGRLIIPLSRKPEAIAVRPGPAPGAPPPPAPPGEGRRGEGGRGEGGRGGAPAAPPAGGGRGPVAGDNFNRASDVAWDKAGNIYVADGYGGPNARVVKMDKNYHYVKEWGTRGSGQGQFDQIRGIAVDAAGNVYVADSNNKRIQVFDGEGTFKSQITNIGTPAAICISPGAHQYLFVSNSNGPEDLDNGEIYKLELDGKAVGKFGRAGRLPKEFNMTNSIDCRTENDLLVGELGSWRVQKVTLKK